MVMPLPIRLTILTVAVVEMQLFDVFQFYPIVSKFYFLPLQHSPTRRTQLPLAYLTNPQLQKPTLPAFPTQMLLALGAQLQFQAGEQSGEAVLLLRWLDDGFGDYGWVDDGDGGFGFVLGVVVDEVLQLGEFLWQLLVVDDLLCWVGVGDVEVADVAALHERDYLFLNLKLKLMQTINLINNCKSFILYIYSHINSVLKGLLNVGARIFHICSYYRYQQKIRKVRLINGKYQIVFCFYSQLILPKTA